MVAREVRDAERWSRFQNAKSGSIPQRNTFYRWAAETVVLRQTVNLFPKGNTGGSNPSPPTKFSFCSSKVEHTTDNRETMDRYHAEGPNMDQ